MRLDNNDAYNVVGAYTILSEDEPLALAEKKVMNLITLLNGRDNLINLGEQTGTLTLYQPKTNPEEGGYQEILFHELGLRGVSQENALLTLHGCGQDFRTLIEQALDSWSWAIDRDRDWYPKNAKTEAQAETAPKPDH